MDNIFNENRQLVQEFGMIELDELRRWIKRYTENHDSCMNSWPVFFIKLISLPQENLHKELFSDNDKDDVTLYGYKNSISHNGLLPEKFIEEYEYNRFEKMRQLNHLFKDVMPAQALMGMINFTNIRRPKESQEKFRNMERIVKESLSFLEFSIYFWYELVYVLLTGKMHMYPLISEFDPRKVESTKVSFSDAVEFMDYVKVHGIGSNINKREMNAIIDNKDNHFDNPLFLYECASQNYFSGLYPQFILSYELYERALYTGAIDSASFSLYWGILYYGSCTKEEFDNLSDDEKKSGNYASIHRTPFKDKEGMCYEEADKYFKRMKIGFSYLRYGVRHGSGMCYNAYANALGEIFNFCEKNEIDFYDGGSQLSETLKLCVEEIKEIINYGDKEVTKENFTDIQLDIYKEAMKLGNPNSCVNGSYILIKKLQKEIKEFVVENQKCSQKAKTEQLSVIRNYINDISRWLEIGVKHLLPEAAHTLSCFLQGRKQHFKEDGSDLLCPEGSGYEFEYFLEKTYFFKKKPERGTVQRMAWRFAYQGSKTPIAGKQKNLCIAEYLRLTKEIMNEDKEE